MDAKRLFQESRDSVVLIMSFDENNQPLAIGSGFFISIGSEEDKVNEIITPAEQKFFLEPIIEQKLKAQRIVELANSAKNRINRSIIVTNYHVVEGASSVRIKMTDGTVAIINTVLGIDKNRDLILLETSKKGKPLTLSDKAPDIGEDVIAIGNPKGLEGTLSAGIVSGLRNEKGSVYYQVTAPISPGSSGGPIINANGEVLGISTFYVAGGQNLNFAIPAAYIRRILKAPKRMELARIPRLERKQDKKIIDKNVKIIEPDVGIHRVSASLLNRSNYPIKNVRYIMIFYKGRYFSDGPFNKGYVKVGKDPLHYILGKLEDTIPPNLAKRFKRGDRMISFSWAVEFRVLDYDIINQPGAGGLIPTFD